MKPAEDHPEVSVVIPTCNRPHLLLTRALPSALAQDHPCFEVVVVVDGPHDPAVPVVQGHPDPRVRAVVLPRNVGGAEARNAGALAARGRWIAFLDDDDEWTPDKLSRQMEVAVRSDAALPVVVAGWVTRTPAGDTPHPWRLPDADEPIGDYLLARRSLRDPTTGFVSSTLLAPRDLVLAVPWTPHLPRHQDWDWVLRAARHPGVRFEFAPEPLVTWYFDEPRPHLSGSVDWRASLDWIDGLREQGLVTDRAFVGFVVSQVAPRARHAARFRPLPFLLGQVLTRRPRAFELARLVSVWLVREDLRRRAGRRLRSPRRQRV